MNRLAAFSARANQALAVACLIGAATTMSVAQPAPAQPAPSAAAAELAPHSAPHPAPVASAASDLWTRPTLTGDWFGARPWLVDRGITIKPRVTQFYQGLAAGDGDHGFEYGGKADVLIAADLTKLGAWEGLSLAVHIEQNFGSNVNGRGGTLLPVNTALLLPGDEDSDAFDVTNVSFTQRFGESFSLTAGKINMVDAASGAAFKGGAGIDAFQHIAFVAPPSGILPPYLFGAIFNVKTTPANFTFMVYDPVSTVNQSGFGSPFAEGVTFRASVEFPVTIAGLAGHQGFSATYSTQDGTDLADLGDLIIPPLNPVAPDTKDNRYHLAYSFDQYLYQPAPDSKEGLGLFFQAAISDGNPNFLDWNAIIGLGGTGLIPGRSQDRWGAGFFYYSVSSTLKDSVAGAVAIDDETGVELFYNAKITPWFDISANIQAIDPALSASDTAVFAGLRATIRF
jgi:porin